MYFLPGILDNFDPHEVLAANLEKIERATAARNARSDARTICEAVAANSDALSPCFSSAADPEKKHQRRSSTADESGLQDYGVKTHGD